MGKVGSGTILHSLVGTGFSSRPVAREEIPDLFGSRDRRVVVQTHNHNFALEVRRFSDESAPPVGLVFVSGIRDLLRRNISAFFENIDNYRNPWWYLGDRERVLSMDLEEVIAKFRVLNAIHTRGLVLPWVTKFLVACNWDANPFSAEDFEPDGWTTLTRGRLKVIWFKLERLDGCFDRIMSELGCVALMIKANAGAEKWYSEMYAEFKRRYRPDPETIELIYDSPIARAFYSAAELQAQKRGWG